MKLIEFQVYDAKSEGVVCFDPEDVEMLVDIDKLGHVGCTQITMKSGTKFFVKSPYLETKQRILNKE